MCIYTHSYAYLFLQDISELSAPSHSGVERFLFADYISYVCRLYMQMHNKSLYYNKSIVNLFLIFVILYTSNNSCKSKQEQVVRDSSMFLFCQAFIFIVYSWLYYFNFQLFLQLRLMSRLMQFYLSAYRHTFNNLMGKLNDQC